MRLKFYTLDVFTDTPFAGNPLAVVRDAQGLDAGRMQAIAREFNLSETIFLLPPRDPVNTARARIFTPTRELPFAGHPTIGAAVLIGLLDAPKMIAAGDIDVVIEEEIGDVRCTVRRPPGQAARARFIAPRLPEAAGEAADAAALARALGLDESDIGFEGHHPSVYSAGVGFTFVPVASRAAVERARPQTAHWDALGPADHPAAFVYCRETVSPDHHVHARMFAPSLGVPEDPATGSAAAAFAGVCMAYENPDDGEHLIILEQGYAMGRPSRIVLGLDVAQGRLEAVTIGGSATLVTEGKIEA